MKYRMIVWHLNHDMAVARGLASNETHMYPYTDASCGFGSKGAQAAKELWQARCYEPVAVVEVQEDNRNHAMEYAFMHTNNIDKSWWAAPRAVGVELLRQAGHRSTSVGDVIEMVCEGALLDPRSECVLYRVASVGFERMKA